MMQTAPRQRSDTQTQPGTVALPIDVWGATDKGRRREGNEDAVYPLSGVEDGSFQPHAERLAQKGQLLIVADGVGGAKAGSEASQWAVRVAVERYYDQPGNDLSANLQSAIEMANLSLYQYLQSTGSPDAGCTMAAVVIHKDMLYVANVGDSRVYVIRDGHIFQQTHDHTLTQQKLDQHIIGPEEAKTDRGRNVLTRSLGARQAVQVDVFAPSQLFQDDVVLVCSDGLTDMLEDGEIVRQVDDSPLRQIARRLIKTANHQGGVDNISVVLARFGKKSRSGGLLTRVRKATLWQKITLLVCVLLAVAAICLVIGIGWWAYDQRSDRATQSPIPQPVIATVLQKNAPTFTVVSSSTVVPTTRVIQPTSTPAPTLTATPTPIPPTRTFTSTPVLPSDTPTQKASGGEKSPTKKPPPPPGD
jgi:protein phosphatase